MDQGTPPSAWADGLRPVKAVSLVGSSGQALGQPAALGMGIVRVSLSLPARAAA